MDISKIRGTLELMHKTGADDSQYILVQMKDLEELMDIYEKHRQEREQKAGGEKGSEEGKPERDSEGP